MYAPFLEKGSEFYGFLDASAAATHEFRIPPKAFLGLHSYCPVSFDAFHAVLVDISVHITLLKSLHNKLGKVSSRDENKDAGATQCDSIENARIIADSRSNQLLYSLSKDNLKHSAEAIGTQILYLWKTFLSIHRANTVQVLECLRETWANDRRAEWSIWMVYSKVEMSHDCDNNRVDEASCYCGSAKLSQTLRLSADPSESAIARAELHRRSITQMRINSRSVQDMQIYKDLSHVPIVIVERVINAPKRSVCGNSYSCNPDQEVSSSLLSEINDVGKLSGADQQLSSQSLKIVVFVHGFQGHHLDLRLVRNQWILIDPKVHCLMSEINEGKTSGDFREMGSRLAKEVSSFLKRKINKLLRSSSERAIKLNFVGHSIGNVIIRTALADSNMEPYLEFLHTYISLSGPHLGYMYSPNSLFNSGLWLLKKLKNTQCMHQLTLTDDPDLCNTFFYELCQKNTLNNFKNVVLLSSPQDGYVPYHSARIEHCPASMSDLSKRGKVFQEMLNNCLNQISSPAVEFMRCDVSFNMSSHGRNLNTFIGRAAHIEFLETDIFAKFIMWSFPELFR